MSGEFVSMAFQGNHHLISIPDLFGIILQHQLHGMLVIASPTRERSFYFQDGQVVYALCNQPREMFGAALVRETEITRETLSEVAGSLTGERYLGEELVHRGLLDQGTIDQVANNQIRRALREVLLWEDWAFQFQELPPPENLPPLRLSTQHLVFDIAREVDEWASVEQLFPDLDAIPIVIAERDRDEVPFELDPALPSPLEVLDHIDDDACLRDVLTGSTHGVLPMAQGIKKLLGSGHLQLQRTRRGGHKTTARQRICALTMIHHLPAQILHLFEAGEEKFDQLDQLLFVDPVLAARTLRVAAVHGHWEDGRPLEIPELTRRIGRETTHSILLAETIRALYLAQPCYNWYPIWERAYRCSLTSVEVARRANYPHEDVARVAGLVQDLGRLLLATLDADLYYEADQLSRGRIVTLTEAEERFFHTDHTKVGTQLAEAWGFPADICKVMLEHHSTAPPGHTLLDIVRLANKAIAAALPCGLPDLSDEEEMNLARSLGLDGMDVEAIRAFARTTNTPSPAQMQQQQPPVPA
ncbi:MAG: HDOD domain-containing protein [Planctomycetota bacterium]